MDKKTSMSSKTSSLYPFEAEEVKHLVNAPLIDAALLLHYCYCLAKHVSFFPEDTVSFDTGSRGE